MIDKIRNHFINAGQRRNKIEKLGDDDDDDFPTWLTGQKLESSLPKANKGKSVSGYFQQLPTLPYRPCVNES
jgi:hypothetical protein